MNRMISTVKRFAKEDRGVVSLVFAVMLPIVVGMMLVAFQFDEYNRYITRVQQSQAVALQGAQKLSATVREDYTREWVKLNTSKINGLSVDYDSDNLAWVNGGYLYSSTDLTDNYPIIKYAVGSRFNSTMRILIAVTPGFEACKAALKSLSEGESGASFASVLQACHKLTHDELRLIPNEYRIYADQLALMNIASFFFRDGKRMTVEEAWSLGGWKSRGITLNDFKNRIERPNLYSLNYSTPSKSLPIIININDKVVKSGDDDLIGTSRTFLRDDSYAPAAFNWMQGDFGTLDEEGKLTYNGDNIVVSGVPKNVTETSTILNNIEDSNYANTVISDNVFFFSNWMIEDMSDWADGDSNFRTLRIMMDVDDEGYINAVRVRVNRGDSNSWRGTYFFELDVIASFESGSVETKQTPIWIDEAKRLADQVTNPLLNAFQSGVSRNEFGNSSYRKWEDPYLKQINDQSQLPSELQLYKDWYKFYLKDVNKLPSKGYTEEQIDAIVERITSDFVPPADTDRILNHWKRLKGIQ